MKRFHVNVTVSDLARSIAFYAELFGCPPTIEKTDYAKWMLDDPHVNFSVTTHGARPGIDHVGLQAEDENEFADIRRRLADAESPVFDQPEVTCCYARSTKAWVRDPDGVAWETFLTRGESTVFGDGTEDGATRVAGNEKTEVGCCGLPVRDKDNDHAACCGPET